MNTMNPTRTAFDQLAIRTARRSSRRALLGRLAKVGAGAALALSVAPIRRVSAQSCAYGPLTCQQGYVWREAWNGDATCVEPWVRDQTANDNYYAASRVDPNGAYGPLSCQQGYVWRNAYDGDAVCVESWMRDQVATDNYYAASRVEPGCADDGFHDDEAVEDPPLEGGGGGTGGGGDDWGGYDCEGDHLSDDFGADTGLCPPRHEMDEEPDV